MPIINAFAAHSKEMPQEYHGKNSKLPPLENLGTRELRNRPLKVGSIVGGKIDFSARPKFSLIFSANDLKEHEIIWHKMGARCPRCRKRNRVFNSEDDFDASAVLGKPVAFHNMNFLGVPRSEAISIGHVGLSDGVDDQRIAFIMPN